MNSRLIVINRYLLLIAGCLDVATFGLVYSQYGIKFEVNFLAVYLYTNYGIGFLLLTKFLTIALGLQFVSPYRKLTLGISTWLVLMAVSNLIVLPSIRQSLGLS